jgi:hypothetical protein
MRANWPHSIVHSISAGASPSRRDGDGAAGREPRHNGAQPPARSPTFELHTTEIARVLQAVIAPAFLFAGIGTFVNVMSQRLSRVVDLARDYDAAEASGAPTHYEATRVSLNERLHDRLAERRQAPRGSRAVRSAAPRGRPGPLSPPIC